MAASHSPMPGRHTESIVFGLDDDGRGLRNSNSPKPLFSRSQGVTQIVSDTDDPDFPEIRAAVQRLCAAFPGPCRQALDRDREYPQEFVARPATHVPGMPRSF
jgi:hypothetical protein